MDKDDDAFDPSFSDENGRVAHTHPPQHARKDPSRQHAAAAPGLPVPEALDFSRPRTGSTPLIPTAWANALSAFQVHKLLLAAALAYRPLLPLAHRLGAAVPSGYSLLALLERGLSPSCSTCFIASRQESIWLETHSLTISSSRPGTMDTRAVQNPTQRLASTTSVIPGLLARSALWSSRHLSLALFSSLAVADRQRAANAPPSP